jgi:hypothetical protein
MRRTAFNPRLQLSYISPDIQRLPLKRITSSLKLTRIKHMFGSNFVWVFRDGVVQEAALVFHLSRRIMETPVVELMVMMMITLNRHCSGPRTGAYTDHLRLSLSLSPSPPCLIRPHGSRVALPQKNGSRIQKRAHPVCPAQSGSQHQYGVHPQPLCRQDKPLVLDLRARPATVRPSMLTCSPTGTCCSHLRSALLLVARRLAASNFRPSRHSYIVKQMGSRLCVLIVFFYEFRDN